MKPNTDIRKMIRQSGFCSWQVADKLGVHENTFYRWLRKELGEEDIKQIYQALEELETEKGLTQIG